MPPCGLKAKQSKKHHYIPSGCRERPEPTAEGIAVEAKITLPTEEEKIKIPQTEPLHKDIPEPEPIPVPVPSQTVADPQPGDMVYVPGFDWLECQGSGGALKRLYALLE